MKENEKNIINRAMEGKIDDADNGKTEDVVEEKLIDFDDDLDNDEDCFYFERPPCEQNTNNQWVSATVVPNILVKDPNLKNTMQ